MEYLSSQVYAVLRIAGPLTASGKGRKLLYDYLHLRRVQATYARELGMTPVARQAIKASGANAALDLVAAMAEVRNEKPKAIDAGMAVDGAVVDSGAGDP